MTATRWLSDAALERLREPLPPDDPPHDRQDLPGGRYEIMEEIGSGGMGTVYRARDRDLDREVALKVLRPASGNANADADAEPAARSANLAGRLLREARILARLEHPGIVPVHDVGTLPDGRIYYAMRLVHGQHLGLYARSAPLPELLKACERVLDAVAFAHAHGVIHRDLKPENVLVGPFGDVLVMDWGVAKLRADAAVTEDDRAVAAPGRTPGARASRVETAHGTVLGTLGYMAPEQERGDVAQVDERTDVFACGVMLRTLLPDGAPRQLAAMCERATAVMPADRYASVSQMADDLARYLAGVPVAAYREGLVERAGRLARRYRVAIYLVLAYLAMRLVLILIFHR